ncbi:MAG: FAD-linked oxidase C-terminal domain-containing protein [Desulfobacterales bacterium]|nr:FAD-linked oxidase C-terminal domain-containing protein [Desulfobacterales bacterium]MDX2510412.1 FAD-linked oxidase C-terminal domain-containing protein [Desulfobacterales bacterium]
MDIKIIESLVAIVGEDNVTDALIDLVSFSYDSSGLSHRPEVALWVQTTEQVAAVLKLANTHKIPVTPRGAGTSLTGSAVPKQGGIVMDMSRMNKILAISVEDRQVMVQPGVVFDDLNHTLADTGFFLPPNPASGKVATIGGNVATNAGGVKGAKYGTTRDYVLDLEVVLADGSILHTGAKTMKCVSGYDLTRLFVGSEGTLGVVTEISLKIDPLPKASVTCTATFESLPQAGKAVGAIMRSGIIPSVLELMDSPSLQAVNKATDLDLPEVAAMLLVETDGYTQHDVDWQMEAIIEALDNNGAIKIAKASTLEEAEKLWAARKAIYGVITRLNYNVLAEDIVVPISKVADMLEAITAMSARSGIMIATVAHAGDGNIHPQFVYDGTNPEEVKKVKQVEAELYKLAIELGGTLTGEHGVGMSKAGYMNLEHDPVFMKVMNGLKAFFDPNAILNPGKLGLDV